MRPERAENRERPQNEKRDRRPRDGPSDEPEGQDI